MLIALVIHATVSFAESSGTIFAFDLTAASDEQLEEAKLAIIQEQKNRIVTKLVLDQDELTIEKGKTATVKCEVTEIR